MTFVKVEWCRDCPCFDMERCWCWRGGGEMMPDGTSCHWAYTAEKPEDLKYTDEDVRDWIEFNNKFRKARER